MMNKIDEKLRLLKPILGNKKAMRLRQMYLFEDNFRFKKEIENRIDLLISRFVKTELDDEIILPPPEKELCQGDINIGEVEFLNKTICPFNLKLKDINRHSGIFGSTGSGKTTMAKNIIKKLHKRGIPFLIFDWEKSYRNLIHDFPDIEVYTVGSDINPIFLNFLTVPPGIKFDEYIKSIIAIISEDYIGGIGADTMLLNYMEMAYQETQNPYFEDLKQIVLREINKDMGKRGKLAGRSGLWKETVSRQINFLSKGASGTVINSRKHYPIEKLFSRPIVLEFGNIKSPHDRKFFIHVILNWLAIYNQHCGLLSEELKQVLIFEEFHNIVMKSKEDNFVSSLFRESRKYGIGLIAIDQTPSEIPNAIFANMNAKMSFALGTNRDISSMAQAMNLGRDRSRFLGMLRTGQAIINVKQRHHDSFLIQTPFIKQDENVWDEELKSAMSKSKKVSAVDSSNLEDLKGFSTFQSIETSPPNSFEKPLSPIDKILLADINEKPFDGVYKRSMRLGFHPTEMVDLHQSLSDKDLIKPVNVGQRKLFEITEDGKELAKKSGIKIQKKGSRGGLEHLYGVEKTLQLLRKHELQPVCEHQDIDIVDKGTGLAIEIETGKSNIIRNLLKLENSRFKRRFMIATNKIAEFKIKQLKGADSPDITAIHLKDFLNLTKEEILNPSLLKLHSPKKSEVTASTKQKQGRTHSLHKWL